MSSQAIASIILLRSGRAGHGAFRLGRNDHFGSKAAFRP
jgi:hypothetical protein